MDLDRRDILKGVGGIAGASAVGGIGLLATTGGASATAGGSISNPDAATSDDGEISYVAVQTTGRVNWDGFDRPAAEARTLTRVRYKRGGSVLNEYQIHDTGKFALDGEWGGDGETTELNGDHSPGQAGYIASDVDWGIAQQNRQNTYDGGYGLPNNPAPTAPFYADADGSTQETRVILEVEYRLYAGSGAELTGTDGYPDRPVSTSEFVVTVNNEASSTSFGDNDAEGDTQDGAEVGV
jgi:hypothetical protein